MTVFLFANNAVTTLAGPIASNSTTLNLASGTGSLFPNPGSGQQFALTLTSQSNANTREIVYCTARTSDVCTIVRGQEGTSALAWIANDIVDNYWTAGSATAMTQASQLQQQAPNYALDTGSTNNVVISLNPAPASLSFLVGTLIRVLIGNTNTGAATINVNGLGATAILSISRNTLLSGALVSGHIQSFIFDGTNFIAAEVNAVGGDLTGGMPSPTLSSGAAVRNLGFTPVQQGGGNLQAGNKIFLGWDGGAPRIQVDTIDVGQIAMRSGFFQQVGGGNFDAPNDYIWHNSIDGTIFQAYDGRNATGIDVITFPNAFPNKCVQVICCEGNPQGWATGSTPTIFGTQQLSAGSFVLYVTSWSVTTSSWRSTGGVAYRYIAIGF